jgi:poly-gamma-glutamate synthesis protein (capsule biosynthesis protein)
VQISLLPQEGFNALKDVARAMGQDPGSEDRFTFLGRRFELGDSAGTRTEPDRADLDRILAAVRAARSWADWVVVATHTHEGGGSREVPADFLVEYAHAAIDAGADVFVGTGPHVLRGVEIRNGRPIFYSLGNFAFENETVPFRPSAEWQRVDLSAEASTTDYYDERQRTAGGYFTRDEVFWESVVALPTFEAGQLAEIRFLPVTLGYGTPRSQRGRPLRATPEASRKIVDRLAELSRPFGTEIVFRDGLGVVRIPPLPTPPRLSPSPHGGNP